MRINASKFLSKLLCASLALPLCATMLSAATAVGSPAADEPTNLALGKTYTIESLAANDHSYGGTEQGAKNQLTDGEYGAPNNFYGGPWAHFVRGFGRVITVDLGDVCAVESVYTRFLQNKQYGIYCPLSLKISLSENGEDFMPAGGTANPIPTTAYGGSEASPQTLLAEYRVSLDQTYRARYVRLTFDVSVNAFCDEIEIYGKTDPGGATALSNFEAPAESKGLPDRNVLGVHDIICFHYGYYPSDEKIAMNSVESFLPFLGYRETDGSYTDTMFDAVMFLIVQGLTEDSNRKMTIDGGPSILSDWEMLIDSAFREDYNLAALDTATAQLKEMLSLPDSHKTAVYLSIPYPKTSEKPFGDLNGDGVEETLSTVDDCVAAVEWYLNRIDEEWSKRNFQNIELKGYFFFSEALENSYFDYESQLARRTVALLHARNYQCVAIPFYQAGGFYEAEEYGFDASIMQANLSFNTPLQEDPQGMMADFLSTAEHYGFGIQMELSHSLLSDVEKYASFYEQYLIAGARSGLMDSVHAYYDGAGPGLFYECSLSKENTRMRWLYEATYKFIKGTLSLPEPTSAGEDVHLEVHGSGTSAEGTLALPGDWYYQYEVVEQPAHGYVRFTNGQTSYRYTGKAPYVGEDSFTVRVLAGDKEWNTIRFTVTITDDEGTESASAAGEESFLASTPEEKEGGAGHTAGMVCAALAGVAAVALLVWKLFFNRKEVSNKD